MSNFDNIIQEINTNLPDNNSQYITAKKLRDTLIDLTETIDEVQDDFETSVSTTVDSFSGTIDTINDNIDHIRVYSINSGVTQLEKLSTWNNNQYISQSNIWKSTSTIYTELYVIPDDNSGKLMLNCLYQNAIYAWLKSDTYSDDNTPDFCTGYSQRIEINDGPKTITVNIPEDAKYLFTFVYTSRGTIHYDIDAYEVGGASNSLTLGEAINLVPQNNRVGKLTIKFTNEDNNVVIWQLQKDYWSANVNDWEKLLVEDDLYTYTTDTSSADLTFSDENGNVLVKFANGGIETKNFNSSSINFNFINLPGIYYRDNIFGVNSNIVYKDAAKRTLPDNIIPLVIIAGQSNADGRAPYNTASNWESTQWLAEANYSVEDYYMWNVSKGIFETYNVLTNNGADAGSGSDGSGEDKFSFDPFFAKKFIDTYNVPVYAVRETLGGIGIEDYVTRDGKKNTWQPKIGYIEHKYGVTDINYLLLRLIEKINNIKKWCDENNKILFPIAILWHQGEHDSNASLLPYFKENTEEVISFIRGIYQTPALPFICGFVQKDYNVNTPLINQAFVEISQIDPYMKAVDMEGHYTSIGDGLHYDGQALAYMGDKMFDYYYSLNNLV